MAALPRSYPRGHRIGLHMHREAQLLYAARGVMQVGTPRGRWLVPPERAVWLPPRVAHAVDALTDIEMRALLVPAGRVAAHPEAGRLGREFVVAVGPCLRATILSAFEGSRHPRRLDLVGDLALFDLAEAEDASTFMPLPDDPRARRVAEMVLADPLGARDLDGLARASGASARTITRLFPEQTDLTFREWRQRARILAAVELLSEGRLTLKQIAARLGFSGSAAFGHAFRQVMGRPPGAMLRRSDPRR